MNDTYRIDCPACDWQSREFKDASGEIAGKVDGALHYVENHDRRIPEDAPFGKDQCPECLALDGFDGTVSCSACGFVPPKVRA